MICSVLMQCCHLHNLSTVLHLIHVYIELIGRNQNDVIKSLAVIMNVVIKRTEWTCLHGMLNIAKTICDKPHENTPI